MAWVEKNHNDHLVSTPLLCAESPTSRPGCPEPHPAWPWMPPWATCSVRHHPLCEKSCSRIVLILKEAYYLSPISLNGLWTLELLTALNKMMMSSAFLSSNGAIVCRMNCHQADIMCLKGCTANHGSSSFCLTLTEVTLITGPSEVKLYWKAFFLLLWARSLAWCMYCSAARAPSLIYER